MVILFIRVYPWLKYSFKFLTLLVVMQQLDGMELLVSPR